MALSAIVSHPDRTNKGCVQCLLLFIIVVKAECREELLYVGDLALISELLEGLKAKLETSKGALESTGLRLNVQKKKIIVIGDKARKVRKEEKFILWSL